MTTMVPGVYSIYIFLGLVPRTAPPTKSFGRVRPSWPNENAPLDPGLDWALESTVMYGMVASTACIVQYVPT